MECREAYGPSDEDLLRIGIDPGDFASGAARRVKFKGVTAGPPAGMLFRAREGGCTACLGAGYKGRTAIYELLIIDEKIRQLAIKNVDAQSLKVAAVTSGMRTLREDGAQKVLAGLTTTAEVLMITTQDAD
jgi:general secretion pathway protein E